MRLLKRGITRLEAFSDAVFAFAATLLVVSLEVPKTFPQLVSDLKGFIAFGLAFSALVLIWSVHNGFFKRYSLEDTYTVVLNSCLLFVVLFYVYPLKFVSKGIALYVLGVGENRTEYGITGPEDLATLFAIYGAAFAAVFLCVALMYLHAYRLRHKLELTKDQRDEAILLFRHYLIFCVVGLLSVATAFSGFGLRYALPGWIYFLLGPGCYFHDVITTKLRKKELSEDRS
ncbi:MAG: DUF1211 domain-containing protein [bacterium]|nr:DUF1211 domain-containing protein [bacterium]